MTIVVRIAEDKDIEQIIDLFCESGSNHYQWTSEKWMHYYRHYSEGHAVSLIATLNNKVVGHYGLLPVKIAETPSMMGLHAYVAKAQRGLTVISALMKEVDRICNQSDVGLICGFANPQFSLIKSTIFKWKTVCWLAFKNGLTVQDLEIKKGKKFYFNYSKEWFEWRFGTQLDNYVSFYRDSNKCTHVQLLKYRNEKQLIGDLNLELWSPVATYPTNQPHTFCQPFSIKIYDRKLVEEGVSNSENWSIDMGDSDTFQYSPEESNR